MLNAYVNYPNARIELHLNSNCSEIQKTNKQGQRRELVNDSTFAGLIANIGSIRLASQASFNDLWFSVDFDDDPEFEEAVVKHLVKLLAQRYTRLANAPLKQHC